MAGANNFKVQRKLINSFKGDPESSVLQTNYLKEATKQDEKTKLTQELSPSQFLLSDVARAAKAKQGPKR